MNNTGKTSVCITPQGTIDTIEESPTISIPKECEHSIIDDLIDIDPDTSQIIYYCEKCYTCFDTIHGNRK